MSKIFRLVETAGLEIEYCNLKIQNNFPREIERIFSYTHDASVETSGVPTYHGIPVSANKPSINKHFYSTTIGREIVSIVPLEVNNSFEIINNLTLFLKDEGVSSKANRAGIHVHITCPPNYSILKEIFNIGLFLEAPLFYFGCMGQEFRGAINSCSYSFPLSKPPIIKINHPRGHHVPLYEIDSVFESKSYSEIAERLGDLINMQGIRYSPARYAYLNYFSTLLRGSLEFRVFNLNLSPFVIDLALRLSGHITKEIIKRSYSDGFRRLGTNSITKTSKKDSIDIMESFLIDTKFEEVEAVILLMEKSPDILINPEPVFTHLHYHPSRGNVCPDMYYKTKYKPKRITVDIKRPVTQQSHNVKFFREVTPITSIIAEIKEGIYNKTVQEHNLNRKKVRKEIRYDVPTLLTNRSIPTFSNSTTESINNSAVEVATDSPNRFDGRISYSGDALIHFDNGTSYTLLEYIHINIDAIRNLLGLSGITSDEVIEFSQERVTAILRNIQHAVEGSEGFTIA